jgi:RNA polymerase sigma-70 factor (ECF subfamily)
MAEIDLSQFDRQARFQAVVLPYLDDALNLACWLSGNRTDAEDIVQEAYLRAFKYFDRYDGGAARPWLLAIVRNACFTWLSRNRSKQLVFVDEARLTAESDAKVQDNAPSSPETDLQRRQSAAALDRAVAALPTEFREVILLREIQGLSYKEIATVIDAPIGTVMSRLARARKLLQGSLKELAA